MVNVIKNALESIDFQSDAFHKELTLAFANLREETKSSRDMAGFSVLVSKIIKKHTNLSFSIDHDTRFGPAVEIPALNKNNILISDYMRNVSSSSDGLRMIAKAGSSISGTVSIANSTVSGVFADVEHKLHYPESFIDTKNITPGELSAAMLHEVGHIFTYYEFISRSATTNQVLAGISKALVGADEPKLRETILINAKQALKLKDLDTKMLSKSSNAKVIETVVIGNVVKESISELGTNIYDQTSWEYLSDQFATRHGAGRDLVTALDKIFRSSGNISYRGTGTYLFMEAIKCAMVVFLPAIAILLMIRDVNDPSYDTPFARLNRIRNQLVEALKDKKITDKYREQLTADITAIDLIVDDKSDKRQLVGIISDFVFPSMRKNRSQEFLQKELEDLAANDLFVKAGELKQMA